MQLTIKIEKRGIGIAGIAKQSAFALANAFNRTLDEGQIAQRAGIHSRFTLRGRSAPFLDRLVKRRREDFATRERLVGRLRIEGPEGQAARAALLTRHELGGTRGTGQGGPSIDPRHSLAGYFYLPTKAIRPSFSAEVPRRIYPSNLRLVDRQDVSGVLPAKVHTTGSGKSQLRGKDRTFVIFSSGTHQPIGIFQRNGGRRGKATARYGRFADGRRFAQRDPNLTKLWSFQRTVTTKPRLEFIQTQQANVDARLLINYRGMLSAAIRTAR
jgi:hypothetical protein